MITAAIRAAFDAIEAATIPGPWPGPDGETWELSIRPAGTDAFLSALEAAGVRPRSYADRKEEIEGENKFSADAEKVAALIQRAVARGGVVEKEPLAELAESEGARKDTIEAAAAALRLEVATIGYDYARYPDAVLTLDELQQVRRAVAGLVVGAWKVAADGTREAVDAGDVAAWFESDERVPKVAPTRDGEPASLYLGGQPEGVALAAWVYRHAAQEHRFWEAVGPLSSASGSRADSPATT